jgi:hypothetical protein
MELSKIYHIPLAQQLILIISLKRTATLWWFLCSRCCQFCQHGQKAIKHSQGAVGFAVQDLDVPVQLRDIIKKQNEQIQGMVKWLKMYKEFPQAQYCNPPRLGRGFTPPPPTCSDLLDCFYFVCFSSYEND